ncbi:hypothetical protein [Persephonella sp.]
MNIAVISFDQELVTEISKKLADYEVKGYTDSLSLLREINFFDPEVIIYDASGGELALNALEFFLSRDKVQGKSIKVLISRENPIDESTLSRFENLDFYDKETEIDKLVEEIKSSAPAATSQSAPEPAPVVEDTPQSIESFEESYQPPADMEALLGETSEPSGSDEIDLSSDVGSLDDVNELLKEMESITPEPEPEPAPAAEPSPAPEPPPPPPPAQASTPEPQPPQAEALQGGGLKITIEISPEEVRRTVLEIAVEKLIDEIKNDVDIQKIKEDLQKDFFDRLEKELKDSVEEIKNSIKEKLFESIEADLKEKVRESIREDVTRITTELVKEKLDQVFGQK